MMLRFDSFDMTVDGGWLRRFESNAELDKWRRNVQI